MKSEELKRYARHLTLTEVGTSGQEKLKQAKVLVVGAGGLGCPALLYLVAAGVGTLGVVDHDVVDESNLQRQVLYTTKDVGKPKVSVAADRLKELNPHVTVNIYPEKLTSSNALKILSDYDIVVDGSDNFPTRYLVNDSCVILKKPLVYGAILRFEGQASVFNCISGPCYRCLFPNPPPKDEVPSCEAAGVLGVLPGVIGTIQATEAIKIILDRTESLSESLLVYNALTMDFTKLNLEKNSKCSVCSGGEVKLIDYEDFCDVPSKQKTTNEISVKELKEIIDSKKDITLVDTREIAEWEMGLLPGAKKVSFIQIAGGDLGAFDEISPDKEIVIYCRTDNRSKFAVDVLLKHGFSNVKFVRGGFNAWANEIDDSLQAY